MFTDLINTFGEDFIERHLQLLKEAINEIEASSENVEIDCEFNRRDTLYSASCAEDVEKLKKEYVLHYVIWFESSIEAAGMTEAFDDWQRTAYDLAFTKAGEDENVRQKFESQMNDILSNL